MRGSTRRGAVVFGLLASALVLIVNPNRAAADGRHFAYGATVVEYSFGSKVLGRRLDEVAIVRPGARKRPLLILLHGRHDRRHGPLASNTSGPESLVSDALLAALQQLQGAAPNVLLLNGGQHSWYHNRRSGRWSSMLLDEAIPDAIRRFHFSADRVAIGGLSMGGYGALHLASLRPRAFCAVGAHSAALYRSYATSASVAFDDAADFARNNVFSAALGGRFDRLPVWIDSGTDDPFREADAAFASVLLARGTDVRHHEWPGGHRASYWRAHMAEYMNFYASALATCSSRASGARPGR